MHFHAGGYFFRPSLCIPLTGENSRWFLVHRRSSCREDGYDSTSTNKPRTPDRRIGPMASTEPVFAQPRPCRNSPTSRARVPARPRHRRAKPVRVRLVRRSVRLRRSRQCEFGVQAKENSLEGSRHGHAGQFSFKSSATILGEEVIDIHHCLVMHPDAKIEDVATVASHAQGLAQCRRFLSERLPGRSTITTSSTAESARLVMENPRVAGIANAFAAELYGRARRGARDRGSFRESDVVRAHRPPGASPVFTGDRYKTSLALFLQVDRAGTLNMILSEFAYAGINLSMIQSRLPGARRLHVSSSSSRRT